MLCHQTATNQTKINELKTTHKYELMIPSKCITNLVNLKVMVIWLFI